MSIWQGFAGAVAGIAGGFLQGGQNRQVSGEMNDWANEAAGVNRAWQERMSNTAHQREVEDLRKAGLNPILSATGGPGASTGSGATANTAEIEPAKFELLSNALEAKLNHAQTELMKAQEEQASSAAELNKAAANKTKKEADVLDPKATVFKKFADSIRSGAALFNNHKKEESSADALKRHNNRVSTPVKGKP